MKYTVQAGDTLSKISQNFYGSISYYSDILQANPQITDENLIYVGQLIEVPGTAIQGPLLPGQSSLIPPSGGGSGVSNPLPAPSPVLPSIVVPEKPAMNKTILIVLAAASAVLGFMILKQFADKKQGQES